VSGELQCSTDSVVPSLVAVALLADVQCDVGPGAHSRNVLSLDVETVRLVRHGEKFLASGVCVGRNGNRGGAAG